MLFRSAAQTAQLEAQLAALEQSKGSQVVVLMVATTQPEDIASYANRVSNVWKIGRRNVGDGVLIVVAKNDGKVRIEVAKTLEGAIPDLAAKQIISNAIVPPFKQKDFAGGLEAGIAQIAQRIGQESLPNVVPGEGDRSQNSEGFQWEELAGYLVYALPLVFIFMQEVFGKKLGTLLSAGAISGVTFFLTTNILFAALAFVAAAIGIFVFTTAGKGGGGGYYDESSSDSSGSSSSSSSGGFSSGGGGDFGGGGASGDF